MELLDKVKKFENLHIVFWLIKDTCWMLEVKWLGAVMVIPTLLVAIYIVAKTRGTQDIFLNLAVFCWISANSFWMCVEFFFNNQFKEYSIVPFILGFVFVTIFYLKSGASKVKDTTKP